MAKKKKEETEKFFPLTEDLPADISAPVVEEPPVEESKPAPVKKSPPVKPAKRMNFIRYARAKGIKPTHLAGMKARVSNPKRPRTIEEWDLFFRDY